MKGLPVVYDLFAERDAAWRRDAACRDLGPELFFPELGGNGSEAKEVCKGCDVKAECGTYALDTHQSFGVWSGMSERELRAARRRRGLRAVS